MCEIFEKILPESVGIPSEAILNFIDELEKRDVNIHSFMMLKKGKILAEGYWKPFHKDFEHRMFSVGKSLTALAIGLLEAQGMLCLNDKICEYFNDKLPTSGVHPWIAETTIHDMLCMATPHQSTTYKRYEGDDWVASFFAVEPTHQPGTIFSYDTSATHVLSALVERLTGESLLDYLKAHFLDEIGFSKSAKWLKDPMNVTQGGSGLICTMRDVAKVAYVCSNRGMYKGKQLIPAAFLEEATKRQIDTSMLATLDERQGYGYQIWQTRYNGFCFYGLGGQLALCFPQYDFILVTTANTQGSTEANAPIYDAFYHQIFPYCKQTKELVPNTNAQQALKNKLARLEIKPLQSRGDFNHELKNQSYLFKEHTLPITKLAITCNQREGTIEWLKDKQSFRIQFGMSHLKMQTFADTTYQCMSSGAWVSNHTLRIQIELIGEVFATLEISLCFKGHQLTVFIKSSGEAFLKAYEGFETGEIEQ